MSTEPDASADGRPGPGLTETQRRLLIETEDVVVATIGPDHQPQLTPVWFLWDGDDFLVSTSSLTVKVRNIRRDPRVTLCIDAPATPAAYVQVTGEAEIIADEREQTLKLIAKYVAEERIEAHWETIRENHVLLRIRPRRWQWFDVADEA